MPNCSGVEAIGKIRSLEISHGVEPIHIVGFTADLSETTTREFLGGGANCVLPKPTPTGELESLCRHMMALQSLRLFNTKAH